MTKTGLNGGLSKKDMQDRFVGCFTLILLFVVAITIGVWLQKETLGIFRLEERLDKIESQLSEKKIEDGQGLKPLKEAVEKMFNP